MVVVIIYLQVLHDDVADNAISAAGLNSPGGGGLQCAQQFGLHGGHVQATVAHSLAEDLKGVGLGCRAADLIPADREVLLDIVQAAENRSSGGRRLLCSHLDPLIRVLDVLVLGNHRRCDNRCCVAGLGVVHGDDADVVVILGLLDGPVAAGLQAEHQAAVHVVLKVHVVGLVLLLQVIRLAHLVVLLVVPLDCVALTLILRADCNDIDREVLPDVLAETHGGLTPVLVEFNDAPLTCRLGGGLLRHQNHQIAPLRTRLEGLCECTDERIAREGLLDLQCGQVLEDRSIILGKNQLLENVCLSKSHAVNDGLDLVGKGNHFERKGREGTERKGKEE